MSINREDVLSQFMDGWHPLANEIMDRMESIWSDVIISQAKEKYGTMRLYVDPNGAPLEAAENLYDLEIEALHRSEGICERCGKPGKLRRLSWIKTLCDKCLVEWTSE